MSGDEDLQQLITEPRLQPELIEQIATAMFLDASPDGDWDNVPSDGAQEDRDYFRRLAEVAISVISEGTSP